MNRSHKAKLMAAAILSALLAAGCSSNADEPAASASASSSTGGTTVSSSGAASAAAVKLAGLDATEQAGFDEDDALTTWSADSSIAIALGGTGATVDGSGATAEGGVVTIADAGTYVVSGQSSDGQIVIDVPEDAVVHLVLNGVQISNDDGPALYVKEADKVIVTLQDGTDNTVADGATYADTSEDAPTAALYSKGDLTINGTGKLTVQGNSNDGIASKDDLKLMSGTIDIQAADDGMIGKDLVAVKDGTVTIDAGGDGIKSTNDADADKGNVAIAGGTFHITAENDGFQAASSLLIDGGTFDIVTGGGSANSTKTHEEQGPGGFGGGGWG
ncbi:carbohydrate-binding domain-containing protein, partial [Cohnella zeiphila]